MEPLKEGKEGDWVRISSLVLKAEERTGRLPEDTASCDLKMWVKGFLISDGLCGQKVKVRTMTGRRAEGILEEINPAYEHGWGECVPELLEVSSRLGDFLYSQSEVVQNILDRQSRKGGDRDN